MTVQEFKREVQKINKENKATISKKPKKEVFDVDEKMTKKRGR